MGAAPYKWTQERIDYIGEHIAGTPYLTMVDMVNEEFGEPYISKYNLKALLAKKGWVNGRDSKFKPGTESWNKGRKMSPEVRAKAAPTMFEKGHRPWNWKPVGSERISVDGYIELKVGEPKMWKLKHRLMWEEAYGPIPKDSCVTFRDSNPLNCTLDNLMLIKRSQLSLMNRNGWHSEFAEITEAGALLAGLMVEGNKRKRRRK